MGSCQLLLYLVVTCVNVNGAVRLPSANLPASSVPAWFSVPEYEPWIALSSKVSGGRRLGDGAHRDLEIPFTEIDDTAGRRAVGLVGQFQHDAAPADRGVPGALERL